MKLSEIKHNHSLTDLLKVFIFSILMLLPFLSVLTRCMYVTFNKNAYQSYYGQTINEKQLVSKSSNFINNEITYLTTYEINIDNSENYLRAYDYIYATLINENPTYPNLQVGHNYAFGYYRLTTSTSTILAISEQINGIGLYNITLSDTQVSTFEVENITYSYSHNNFLEGTNIIRQYEYNKYSYLDNVFEYSFQKMSQDDMFNWTQNTALYSGIHAMTTNLQIQTNVIAILLTYWTILTIVYVIIDIVLKCFTLLTHGFNRKTS